MRKFGSVLTVTRVAMLAFVLAVGLVFVSCDNDTTSGGGSKSGPGAGQVSGLGLSGTLGSNKQVEIYFNARSVHYEENPYMDFNIFILGEQSTVYSSFGTYYNSVHLYASSRYTLTYGQKYTIRVEYTANSRRPIYLGNTEVLRSFTIEQSVTYNR